MNDHRDYLLGPPYSTTPAVVTTNKENKIISLKNSENVKKEDGPDRAAKNNQLSFVTLNKLPVRASKNIQRSK